MAKAEAKPSPFAPARLPNMPAVPGVRFAACQAGIRYAGRTDLMIAVGSAVFLYHGARLAAGLGTALARY